MQVSTSAVGECSHNVRIPCAVSVRRIRPSKEGRTERYSCFTHRYGRRYGRWYSRGAYSSMSYDVKCDECEAEVDIRGYAGHLRMSHGIHGEEMRDMVEMKKAYTPPSRQTKTRETKPESEPSPHSEGEISHANQVRSDGDGGAVSVCTMCGRSAEVRSADQVATLLEQQGADVPQALLNHEYYCSGCQYAFGGESNE